MKILDLSAGNRWIWYNKNHPDALYLDCRKEVNPDIVCDTKKLPGNIGSDFNLFCWDPPHLNFGANSNMSKCYGHHTTAEILETIKQTSREAHRVAAKDALLALKWNDHDIRLQRVFDLMPDWEPLFGNLVSKNKRSQTYWIMMKTKT